METDLIFSSDEAGDALLGGSAGNEQVAALPNGAIPFDDALPDLLDAAQVVIPEGQTVIHVAVTPGEVVELPFGPEVQFLAAIGNGNLAIKVGDIVVILEGYVAASEQNPPVVEASDGTPLDIAALLAATDPSIDIETAAGPGAGNGAGADNSGAIFQQFGEGGGLGGFTGVGGQENSSGPGGFGGDGAGGGGSLSSVFAVNAAPVVADVKVTTDEDTAFAGKLTGFDADGDPLTFHTTGLVPAGVNFNPDGTWSFDPSGKYDFLAPGQEATIAFQYQANDGKVDSNAATVTLTIEGVNDAPVISSPLVSLGPSEDLHDTFNLRNAVQITDPDSTTFSFVTDGTWPAGFVLGSDGTLHIDTAGHFDYLQAGEQAIFDVPYKVSDGLDFSNTLTLKLIVNGVNDVATIAGDATGSVTEDVATTATGTLNVVDADHDQSHTQVATNQAASYGSWSVDADGHWSYTVDDGNATVNALGNSGTLTDSFTVKSQDGTASEIVTVTIHGHNDAPVAGNSIVPTLNEEAVAVGDVGQFVSDADTPGANLSYSAVGAMPVGITLNSNGLVGLDFAGNYDYLAAGESLNYSFDYKAFDGVAYSNVGTVIGTIIGVNDAAAISGDAAGSATEDVASTVKGVLYVNDLDDGESHTEAASNHAATYGSWSVDADGHWTYALDNGNVAVNALNAGDTLTDSFTVKSLDGTASQLVTVTIHGHDDAPVALNDTVITNNGAAAFDIPDWALLANDKDPNGATLGVTAVAGGAPDAALHVGGGDPHVAFADGGALGGSFTYAAASATDTSHAATVTVFNQAGGDLAGAPGREILIGSAAGEKIDGYGGGDLIFGGGGDDTLIFHQGDRIAGGLDSVAQQGGLADAAANHGDVLVLDQTTDLTLPGLDAKLSGIETISLLNAESGASGAQSLTVGASDIVALSDHTITPGGVFAEHAAVRLDADAVDQLYLSISKDGGEWADTGISAAGYAIFAHETTAGDAASADAYVMVAAANAGNVHLNQDAP